LSKRKTFPKIYESRLREVFNMAEELAGLPNLKQSSSKMAGVFFWFPDIYSPCASQGTARDCRTLLA
jgi:hypothetical protein